MHILVKSVPHTGTNFLVKILEAARCHIHIQHYADYRNIHEVKEDFTISPIRCPWMQWVTHTSRKTQVGLIQSWLDFNERFLNDENLMILPIDTGDRQTHLDVISERIGVQFKTDWMPVGGKKREELIIPDLSWLYDLPVVKKYYDKPI